MCLRCVLRHGSKGRRKDGNVGHGADELGSDHLRRRWHGLRGQGEQQGQDSAGELLDDGGGQDIVIAHDQTDDHDFSAVEERRENADAVPQADGEAFGQRYHPDAGRAYCRGDKHFGGRAAAGDYPPDERHSQAITRAQKGVLRWCRHAQAQKLRPKPEERCHAYGHARLQRLSAEISLDMGKQDDEQNDARPKETDGGEPGGANGGYGAFADHEAEAPDGGGRGEDEPINVRWVLLVEDAHDCLRSWQFGEMIRLAWN